MILDIYNDSIKYSIKNSKSLLYFGLTLFSTFIIWMAYILILIHYQEANLNLKFASLIVPSLLTLIPIFLFLGYEYRILEISTHGMINGTDKVPEFNNLKEMLINGVKIFLVKFVYFAVPIIILAVTTTPFLDNISGGIIQTAGATISMILAIILYFVSFISLSNMAAHDNFKKAFDFKEIKEVILTIGPARYVLFYRTADNRMCNCICAVCNHHDSYDDYWNFRNKYTYITGTSLVGNVFPYKPHIFTDNCISRII